MRATPPKEQGPLLRPAGSCTPPEGPRLASTHQGPLQGQPRAGGGAGGERDEAKATLPPVTSVSRVCLPPSPRPPPCEASSALWGRRTEGCGPCHCPHLPTGPRTTSPLQPGLPLKDNLPRIPATVGYGRKTCPRRGESPRVLAPPPVLPLGTPASPLRLRLRRAPGRSGHSEDTGSLPCHIWGYPMEDGRARRSHSLAPELRSSPGLPQPHPCLH